MRVSAIFFLGFLCFSVNAHDLKNNNELELSSLKDLEESFKKETEFWQNAMNNKKINLLNQIEDLINRTISEFAIEEGYDLILYKNIAFVSDKVNITNQIIEKIEKQSP